MTEPRYYAGRDPNRLYRLLPALYRIADEEHGHQLRALLALITEQADALRTDTQQLWDDFFIETCRRWVVPYLGELVGNTPLHDLDLSPAARTAETIFGDLAGPNLEPPGAIRTRVDVARTIYYRRRKGTPAMLEELARDVTGWGARVVEFFTLLNWNQHLEHLRLDAHGCPDLRRVDVGDRVGGPWDTTPHTVDVRRINQWDGWHNVPSVGFFLWRLEAYPLIAVTPRQIGAKPWRLTFSPLGQDVPLFSAGRRTAGDSRPATEPDLQAPIRPAAFFEDLAAAKPNASTTDYYGDPLMTDGSLVILHGGDPVPANRVRCRNLKNWNDSQLVQPDDGTFWIDVSRGRLLVPTKHEKPVTVSFHHGFSAPMGGGRYPRRKWLVPSTDPVVVHGGNALQTEISNRAKPSAVITIGDDATYEIRGAIDLAPGESLTIQAADGTRPHVRIGTDGSLAVLKGGKGSALTLSGLLVEGGLHVKGDLDLLRLLHTTLVPGRCVAQEAVNPPSGPSIVVDAGSGAAINTRLEVQIAFSIVGMLTIPSHITKLWLLDSIVVGAATPGDPGGIAISDTKRADGPLAHVERSTVFGRSWFRTLDMASESIFTGLVVVDRRHEGCVRFSYVPASSITPRQYRCQPSGSLGKQLVPAFTDDRYGRPGFAQLRGDCPVEIRTGAEDGSEMGAFCVLKQPQRESNLRLRLDEYLPVGLEAGLIHVT